VLRNWLNEDPTRIDYFLDLVASNKLLVTYKGVRSLAKIVASPTAVRTKAFNVLDSQDGDIEKALQVLETKGMTSKGLWGTVSKLQKSLGRTTYEEFADALKDTSKIEMLEETITTLEDIRRNIQNLQAEKNDGK
jgi:vacuolar-type H+-ATPase subunit I/STV1